MIRPAQSDDDLATIAREGSITGLSHQRAHELVDAARRSDDCLVSLDASNRVVGFVIMNRGAFFGRDFVKLVVVTPPHRRTGIGAELVAAALSRARTDKVFISTNESNVAMRRLLVKAHWTLSGVLEGLDEGDPEMVFWKVGPAGEVAPPR